MSVKLFVGITNGLGLKVDERALAQLRQEREDRLKWRRERAGGLNRGGGIPFPVEHIIQNMIDCLEQEDECWLWTRSIAHGYGDLGVNQRHWLAPRLIYFLTRAPAEMPENVCHECDTPKCCNPHHLFPGDMRINIRNSVTKGRMPRGERSYQAKLTDRKVIEIRETYDAYSPDNNQRCLAEKFGVGQKCISKIVNRHRWKHLP